MNKYFLFAFLFLAAISTNAKKNTASTPIAVQTLLSNIETLEALSPDDKERAIKLRMDNQKQFDGPPAGNGINMDRESIQNTELTFVGLPSAYTSNAYCRSLYENIYQKKLLKQQNTIMGTTVQSLPGPNGKDEPWTYVTTVHKKCTYNDKKSVELTQMITVNYDNHLISEFSTVPYTPENIRQEKKQTIVPAQPIVGRLSEQQYLNLVSRYYSSKDYAKAFDTLMDLVENYDSSAQGWYRLGLMVYYGQKGCKNRFQNKRAAALKFLKKAAERAKGKLKRDIECEISYIEIPGGNYM